MHICYIITWLLVRVLSSWALVGVAECQEESGMSYFLAHGHCCPHLCISAFGAAECGVAWQHWKQMHILADMLAVMPSQLPAAYHKAHCTQQLIQHCASASENEPLTMYGGQLEASLSSSPYACSCLMASPTALLWNAYDKLCGKWGWRKLHSMHETPTWNVHADENTM